MSFTFQKDRFDTGDPRPEMYFNCKDITDATAPIDYKVNPTGQAISYTINFSQSMQINTLGCDTLSYDIGRDIDDLCVALQTVADIETKITKLKDMHENGAYTDAEREKIATMIEAANKERDYALDSMEKTSSSSTPANSFVCFSTGTNSFITALSVVYTTETLINYTILKLHITLHPMLFLLLKIKRRIAALLMNLN